jgi:hypothetical protein
MMNVVISLLMPAGLRTSWVSYSVELCCYVLAIIVREIAKRIQPSNLNIDHPSELDLLYKLNIN